MTERIREPLGREEFDDDPLGELFVGHGEFASIYGCSWLRGRDRIAGRIQRHPPRHAAAEKAIPPAASMSFLFGQLTTYLKRA
jgi:hypothetical protein